MTLQLSIIITPNNVMNLTKHIHHEIKKMKDLVLKSTPGFLNDEGGLRQYYRLLHVEVFFFSPNN